MDFCSSLKIISIYIFNICKSKKKRKENCRRKLFPVATVAKYNIAITVDVERRQSYEIFECKLLLYTCIALLWVNLYTVYNNMFRCVKLGGGNTCKRILELLISRANSFHGVRRVKENIIKNQIKKFSFYFLFYF